MLGTIGLHGLSLVVIPKGFFPQQDTGLIVGIAEAAQDISYDAMTDRMRAVVSTVLKDPAVSTVGAIWRRRPDRHAEPGPHVHCAKAAR